MLACFKPACLGVLLVLAAICSAQDANISTQNGSASRQTGSSTEESKPDAARASEKHSSSSQRGSFVGAPIPTSSPAIGSGLTFVGGYIFPFRKSDKVSPPSVIGGGALITNNGTRAFAVATELYFKADRYHVLTGYAHGNLNYDFYGTGTIAGDAGIRLGLKQNASVFFGQALRRIGWRIFVGPRVWLGTSTIAPEKLGETHPELPSLDVNMKMRSLGFKIERDTRPNRFYPTKGTLLEFSSDFFSKGMGGTFTFQRYRFTFNGYRGFDDKQVLAYNVHLCSTGGQAPFFGQCIFGMQNILRGYPAGRYIDRKMIAAQAEYRLVLPKRLGVVGFAGLGEVAPSLGSFNHHDLLGSIGGGLRFTASKKYHVNLRVDLAHGKNGQTFSMGLGEAF